MRRRRRRRVDLSLVGLLARGVLGSGGSSRRYRRPRCLRAVRRRLCVFCFLIQQREREAKRDAIISLMPKRKGGRRRFAYVCPKTARVQCKVHSRKVQSTCEQWFPMVIGTRWTRHSLRSIYIYINKRQVHGSVREGDRERKGREEGRRIREF